MNVTAKILLGYKDPSALEQAQQFNNGPLEQRYGYAILVNEISGPNEALSALASIDEEMKEEVSARKERGEDEGEFPTESQVKLRRVLGTLFEKYEQGDYDSSTLADADRESVEEQAWLGFKSGPYTKKVSRWGDSSRDDPNWTTTFSLLVYRNVSGAVCAGFKFCGWFFVCWNVSRQSGGRQFSK